MYDFLLTNEQRQRLKEAKSAGIYRDKREHLTDERVERTANKIDEILLELHQEEPYRVYYVCT